MRLKSYFADTVEEAISLARREMGSDAMLVNSKRAGAEAQHLGSYEVVCAAEAGPVPATESKVARAAAAPPMDQISQEVAELRQQMERLARSLARSGAGMAGIAADSELSKAFAALTDAELDADLAYEVISRIASPASAGALRTELTRLVAVDPQLGRAGAPARIVALVGPPGAGKTATLVKLAAQYGIAARTPTQLLTVDTYRIAAADELQYYASILGIGCQFLDTTAALGLALDEHRSKGLILIDTPGLAAGEMDGFENLPDFLASQSDVDVHLVLPASMRTSDMKRAAQQYSVFQPHKLIFTRLDETETAGPILSQSVRMQRPVSFLSHGQRIPEDLAEAAPELLLDLVLKSHSWSRSRFGVMAA